jgi:hypothetical protein
MAKKKETAPERGLNKYFDYWDQTTAVPVEGSFADTTVAYVDCLARAVYKNTAERPEARELAKQCVRLVKQFRSSPTQQVIFDLGDWSRRLELAIGPEGAIISTYDDINIAGDRARRLKHQRHDEKCERARTHMRLLIREARTEKTRSDDYILSDMETDYWDDQIDEKPIILERRALAGLLGKVRKDPGMGKKPGKG